MMEHVGAVITAIVGLLAVLGGAVKWVADKLETRFTKIEAALDECRAREDASQERRHKRDLAIELLIQAIKTLHPASWNDPSLEGAKVLLTEIRNEGK